MHIACIDLGTNSLLLTIARWDGVSLYPIHEEAEITRLGQDLQKTGEIQPESQKRSMEVLNHYLDIIKQHYTETTLAVGTEALRQAKNGKQFIEQIKNRLGISIQIISAQKEAKLTFKATQREFSFLNTPLIMFDIGGGSTEIVIGTPNRIDAMYSFDIGTVVLTEKFIHHDSLLPAELHEAGNFIQDRLQTIVETPKEAMGIGTAGTITSLKAITLQMEIYNSKEIHQSRLSRREVNTLMTQLTSMTISERQKLKGLHPKRADIIPMGALITQCIMEKFRLSEITVSDRGLRWGVLYDWIEKQKMKK